jgi:hypothetical protein
LIDRLFTNEINETDETDQIFGAIVMERDMDKESPIKSTPEECEWCGSTGEHGRTRRVYWITVGLIAIFIVTVYLLAR